MLQESRNTECMTSTYYRINRGDEPAANLLRADRVDGWTVEGDRQLPGVAACESLAALNTYVSVYGLRVEPGDRLVAVRGYDAGPDIDAGAVRVRPVEAHDVGDAHRIFGRIARAPRGYEDAAADVWQRRVED